MGDRPLTGEEICDARDLATRIERDGAWSVSESFQSVVKDSRGGIVVVADGDLFNGRDFERDAEDIVAARNAFPSLLAEIDRLTKERDEQARLVRRLREIASVAARHLESNRNSRRDNHEAGAAVRRELARYFGETSSSKEEATRG